MSFNHQLPKVSPRDRELPDWDSVQGFEGSLTHELPKTPGEMLTHISFDS